MLSVGNAPCLPVGHAPQIGIQAKIIQYRDCEEPVLNRAVSCNHSFSFATVTNISTYVVRSSMKALDIAEIVWKP